MSRFSLSDPCLLPSGGLLLCPPSVGHGRVLGSPEFASDEKGFSVSDCPYRFTVRVSQTTPSEFPANFVLETSATELDVLGPQARGCEQGVLPNGRGGRRRPSDYAAAPRPLVVSAPAPKDAAECHSALLKTRDYHSISCCAATRTSLAAQAIPQTSSTLVTSPLQSPAEAPRWWPPPGSRRSSGPRRPSSRPGPGPRR